MLQQKIVLCSVTTSEFATALCKAVDAANGHLIISHSLDAWSDDLDTYFPWLGLLDIDTWTQQHEPEQSVSEQRVSSAPLKEPHALDSHIWESPLKRAKLMPQTKYIPLMAFGRDDNHLATASCCGADEVWQQSSLVEKLGEVVARYLDPPIRFVSGWDEPLPEKAKEGVRHFNQRDYFEQHELFEDAWRAESRAVRDLYQGVLQMGVAFYQIELGNWRGAIKTFRRGLPKLRDLPPTCQGIDLASFRTVVEQIHIDIAHLGAERLEEFEQSRFPQIRVNEIG